MAQWGANIVSAECAESAAWCRRCAYPLDGLPSSRCPECGTPFDLDDPSTFATRPAHRGTNRAIVIAYACALVIGGLLPQLIFARMLGAVSLVDRLQWFTLQACGPLATFVVGCPEWWLLTAIASWCGWVTIVCVTPYRAIPAPLHFVFGLIWCAAATPATMQGA